jgi:hypothetical protein
MICGGTLAAVLIAAIGALNKAAHAQQAAAPSAQFAPIETPKFDPDLLKPPHAALSTDVDKFRTDKSGNAAAGWTLPKGIDVGKYQLQFDANHTSAVTAPRMDMDSGESSNLSKIAPGRREEPVLPNYFGLKLSAPTH